MIFQTCFSSECSLPTEHVSHQPSPRASVALSSPPLLYVRTKCCGYLPWLFASSTLYTINVEPFTSFIILSRGVQPLGISGPQWKKSCLGHIKYIATCNHTKQSHNALSKFAILCWAAFTAVLGHVQPAGCRVDTPAGEMKFYF